MTHRRAHETSLRRRRLPRRLLALLGYVLAVCALGVSGTGVTYGILSATSPEAANGLSTGTVTLTGDAGAACGASGMLPDGTPSTCTLQVTYGGSAPAYLGLDILVVSRAGAGGSSLYDPLTAGGLVVNVTSAAPTVTYQLPTAASACPATVPAGSTCYRTDGALVSTTPFSASSAPVTFTTSVSLPTSSPTGFQGGSAEIVLTAHAAQAGNNATAGCVAGRPCPGLSWS